MVRSGYSTDNLSDVDNLQGISRSEYQKDGGFELMVTKPISKDQRSGCLRVIVCY